jgi:hypothetical protein
LANAPQMVITARISDNEPNRRWEPEYRYIRHIHQKHFSPCMAGASAGKPGKPGRFPGRTSSLMDGRFNAVRNSNSPGKSSRMRRSRKRPFFELAGYSSARPQCRTAPKPRGTRPPSISAAMRVVGSTIAWANEASPADDGLGVRGDAPFNETHCNVTVRRFGRYNRGWNQWSRPQESSDAMI